MPLLFVPVTVNVKEVAALVLLDVRLDAPVEVMDMLTPAPLAVHAKFPAPFPAVMAHDVRD